MSMKHISEIDGLRAIAVLAVLLFHAKVQFIGGGFVGVDVFFVISGYLITKILLVSTKTDQNFLANFYVRRILRIVPALTVVLAATACIFFFLMPPSQSTGLMTSLSSAVASISNIWFYSSVDYFSDNSKDPALHTWSLAVEEQFYIALPLLLLVLRKKTNRTISIVIAGLLAISLISAVLITPQNQAAGFYFPWLRAWELLAGSLLSSLQLDRLNPILKRIASEIGLLAILAACLFYTESMTFPGLTAVLPVAGSMGIIVGIGSNSVANRILRLRFMRWTGKISYSLYLVHWPIVCIPSLIFSLGSIKLRVFVVLASFAAGWLSWRYVETPFRKLSGTTPNKRVFIGYALSSLGLLSLFYTLHEVGIAYWQHHPTALKYSEVLNADRSWFRNGTCFITSTNQLSEYNESTCLSQSTDKPNVLVIGDSHAANLVHGLSLKRPDLNFLQMTIAGCRPTLNGDGETRCKQTIRYYLMDWLPKHGQQVSYVVIGGRWYENDLAPLKETIAYLNNLGKKIIVLGPTPEYVSYVPLMLAYQEFLGMDLSGYLAKPGKMELDQKFMTELSADVKYVSAYSRLCNGPRCTVIYNNNPTMFDRDHFTMEGVNLIIDGFPLPPQK
jgi:peptidoglycan/LPS O-acetylase OafA/YrhL